MAKKIFTYKGKTIEELQAMSMEEFIKLVPARQKRSLTRGMTDKQKRFLGRLKKTNKPMKTDCRNIIIIPEMVGKKIIIHKGNEWVPIEIKAEMITFRLGDFVLTRKRVQHSSPGLGATKSSKFTALK
ncbi:MAG: 30S ribosomal protein S19 [Nanoarchaeota archaeon]|nr:30S ribosomal protein S19 [Nanoarchaeota archaeon]